MKLYIAITFCSLLLLSSCSQQLYSYRQKVPVNKSVAKVNKDLPSVSSEYKSLAAVETAKINPSVSSKPMPSQKIKIEDKALAPVIANIQQMAPQGGSKSSGVAPNLSFKSVQQQVKAIKKEINNSNGVHIDGMRWIIVGLILLLIGLILNLVGVGGIIYAVGGIVLLIGLIFYLIEILV
ncbi:MAG: hypothetical protein Q8M15_05140 [Bacteroidota bacterium]|nr:hypothetical protein [Bacteroidota bacterium]